jgi:outer membrane protein OmpA-like peptidoglycan-associated protein
MKRVKYYWLIAMLFIVGNVFSQITNPQKVFERKVNNKVNRAIDKKAGEIVDSAFKPIEGTNEPAKKNNPASTPVATKDTVSKNSNQSGLQAYSKFDFVPGEKVILYEDFSQDAVGDFPALWTTNAPGEINTLNIAPGHWLNLNSTDGNYFLLKRIEFPKNFIIEFDIVPKTGGGRIAAGLILYGEDKPKEMDNNPRPGTSGIMISIEKASWNTLGYKSTEQGSITGSSSLNPVEPEKVNHVIIWVQGRRVRIYHKSAKVLDMPTNMYDGTQLNRVCFRLSRGASCASYISNFRITDASPDMRSKLLTEGKLVSYGIYFDVNKDVVKAESYGTIKSIADVLTENADVKIKIVGHTDADGNDAANMDLSKRRAAAVKNELVKTFSIDASRIETDGKGETKPVAPNDTPSNKALNRRVEFIKL